MSQSGILNSQVNIPGTVAETFVANVGSAVPIANIINVLGANGISTTGSSNTLTISPTNAANSFISLSDDFFTSMSSGGNSTALFTTTGWNFSTGPLSDSGHPGFISNIAISAAQIVVVEMQNFSSNNSLIRGTWALGGGALTFNWVFKIINLSAAGARYTLTMGMGDTDTTSLQANGVYFSYTDNVNSGNWVTNTSSASVSTATNQTTAVTAGWHNAQIAINAAGTSVVFTMDGVSYPAITTNIPTTGITPLFLLQCNSGNVTSNTILVDLFYLSQTLTVAR